MSSRGTFRPARSCRRTSDGRLSGKACRRCEAAAAARRAARRTTRRRAAGCCSRRSACSRPTRSRPKFVKRCTGESDVRCDRRRSRENLQGAARAHRGRCDRMLIGCAGRQETAGGSVTVRPRLTMDHRTRARPLGLLAELTHRCPLGCPYCSNPLALDRRDDELDTATWARVFNEAAALGVLQVHLSGGEPAARRDLRRNRQGGARSRPLQQSDHVGGRHRRRRHSPTLADAGLDHVQISIQDCKQASADHIAGYKGASARKRALAGEVVRLGLPLTVNMVDASRQYRAHRARWWSWRLSLGASRVEIAHVQYYGWALKNRAALMPTRAQVERSGAPGRDTARAPSRPDRHRRGRARLLRALSEALRRRLGPPLAQRDAGRQGAALPRRRSHSRP